ncbi:cytochrome c oxidase subunit 3 family protein [Aureimonas leprariae]|uniref:Cytochrome c oxidase subunit 3 family protein n=2 Tax=Plantimonas leprariae TaxID=2615207 RepID=A0A7V7PTG1_9HYPH|nr:cytochrome c oxidase subunit 3 family protein [Aureimonas leprariae]
MWTFLASEMLFFGGLFLAFAIYRFTHAPEMAAVARETNLVYGTVNAAILHVSSVAMALAEKAGERGLRDRAAGLLALTAALGLAFLAVKGFEYAEDLDRHLLPGPDFALGRGPAQLFWGFYWAMTGIHAIHLTIGIAAVALFAWRVRRDAFPFRPSAGLAALGLYWHLIDVVWIVLYPMLYLGGRS